MADVANTLPAWSTTRGSNSPSGATAISSGLDDNLREIQGVVKGWLASKGSDILSATTTDLGAVEGLFHDITGTTTITGFGTIAAGTWKVLKFEGALTLTHNATSLIIPGGANITTADGDMCMVTSEGSGNWRLNWYIRANGEQIKINTQGADVASASTINLDTATGDLVDVTGTTTITAVTLAQGKCRTVRFTGILTFTHGASLVLPGSANITTAAGDFAILRGYASSVVRCVGYFRADGTPVTTPTAAQGASLVLLGSGSASSSASISFTSKMSSTYDDYIVKILNAVPASSGALLVMRMSVDNGANYFNSANDYAHGSTGFDAAAATRTANSGVDSSINIGGFPGTLGLSNTAADGGFSGTVELFKTNTTTQKKNVCINGVATLTGPATSTQTGIGVGIGAANGIRDAAVNAIQFFMSTGNIASGDFYLYGVKKT